MTVRRVTWYLAIATSLLPGCTSVILVDPNEPLDNDRVFNCDQVHARLLGEPAIVTSTAGRESECYMVEVRRDSVVFFDRLTGRREAVRTGEVLKLTATDHGAGALTGGIVGTLGGIGVGTGLFLAISDGSADSRMGAAVLFVGAMAGGAIVGGVTGYLNGSSQVYRFKEISHDSATGAHILEAGAP